MLFTASTHATSRDLLITRTAIFSTLGSYIYTFLQDDNRFSVPFQFDTQHPNLSYTQGKEYSTKPHRHLKNHQLSLGLDWQKTLKQSPYFNLTGHTEFNINHWHSADNSSQNSEGFIFALTPMFTYTLNQIECFSHTLYLETGIGFALMDNSIVENRNKSSLFQFTDTIGLGFMKNDFRLGYRFTHVSNLDIKSPNPSVDLHQLLLSYRF